MTAPDNQLETQATDSIQNNTPETVQAETVEEVILEVAPEQTPTETADKPMVVVSTAAPAALFPAPPGSLH